MTRVRWLKWAFSILASVLVMIHSQGIVASLRTNAAEDTIIQRLFEFVTLLLRDVVV